MKLIIAACFVASHSGIQQVVGQRLPLTSIRDIDGTNNNDGGQTHALLVRKASANYPDGFGDAIWMPDDVPSARLVSNTCCAQGTASISNARGLSDMVWAFGQFLE